jgi:hypothetical protein
MDLDISTVAQATAALGGVGVVRRIFGPAADEVAEALRRLTEYRLRNVGRVVAKAEQKSPSSVTPAVAGLSIRALEPVLQHAGTADDDIVADYLGGVLSTCRRVANDDSLAWTALISRMAARELRLHYQLYTCVRRSALGRADLNVLDSPGRHALRAHVGMDSSAIDLRSLPDVLAGLEREGLLGGMWSFGKSSAEFPGSSTLPILDFEPSLTGMNLFAWGQGFGEGGARSYLTSTVVETLPDVPLPPVSLPNLPARPAIEPAE